MMVFVFGNPDLPQDSLPLTLLPALQKRFPQIAFEVRNPPEEWEAPSELMAIDTVLGIKKVKIFTDLDAFQSAPRLTPHDFDALSNLHYLQKLGKVEKITIIGIPPELEPQEAFDQISAFLSNQL